MVYLVLKKWKKSSKRSKLIRKILDFTILGVEGLKKISLISDNIESYIKENNLTGTYLDYIVSLFIKEVIRCC